jgi:hypothetical protein
MLAVSAWQASEILTPDRYASWGVQEGGGEDAGQPVLVGAGRPAAAGGELGEQLRAGQGPP